MKKMLLVIIAAGSMAVASAQVQFGVKAGYNLASLTESGSQTSGLKSKSGFNAGVMASVPLFNSFHLQPELVYSGQGASYSQDGFSGNLNYNYLNVPVLFQYQHESGFFAETGPQVGFLISAKATSGGQSQDIKSSAQSVDFAWALGLGYKIPNTSLGINARYNLGLTNMAKDSGSETVKNSVFQFGLFYILGQK